MEAEKNTEQEVKLHYNEALAVVSGYSKYGEEYPPIALHIAKARVPGFTLKLASVIDFFEKQGALFRKALETKCCDYGITFKPETNQFLALKEDGSIDEEKRAIWNNFVSNELVFEEFTYPKDLMLPRSILDYLNLSVQDYTMIKGIFFDDSPKQDIKEESSRDVQKTKNRKSDKKK